MKAEELRIGNFIEYYIGEDGINWTLNTVDVEDLKWCDLYESDFNKHHRAIPLTEQWLERFGFEPNGVYKSMRLPLERLRTHGTRTFIVVAHDGDTWIELINRDKHNQYKELQSHCFQCKYVHQLQNLYYALTFEELTLKEK